MADPDREERPERGLPPSRTSRALARAEDLRLRLGLEQTAFVSLMASGLDGALLEAEHRSSAVGENPGGKRAAVVEVSSYWRDLGVELDFLPVFDHLAVLVHETDRARGRRRVGKFESLIHDVHRLVHQLEGSGYGDTAVAVAAVELPDDIEEGIFDAGAQLIVVDEDFMVQGHGARIERLQIMLADAIGPARDTTRPIIPDCEDDKGLYDAPNRALSEEQIADWVRAVEQPDEHD